MKKYLFLALALLTAALSYADVEVTSGSLVKLKDADSQVSVRWDYTKMLIEGKKPATFLKEKGKDWQRDYPNEVAAGENAFLTTYNKKCKKFAKMTKTKAGAKYEYVIHVKNFHYGSTGAAIAFGSYSRGASIDGTIEVKEVKSRKTICTLSFDGSGKASFGNEARRILAMKDLAEDLAKAVKKAK
jgi:hypothetical protein